jgi:putative addiction module killer protein
VSIIPLEVKYYQTENGEIPLSQWLTGLTDPIAKRKINLRIARLSSGYLGDHEFYGEIGELRDFSGPGYRLYFGKDGKKLIIMLAGGDKDSQSRDFRTARSFWADYKRRRNGSRS